MLRSRMARGGALAGAARAGRRRAGGAGVRGDRCDGEGSHRGGAAGETPPGQTGEPGAAGIGDPYFPLLGNGG